MLFRRILLYSYSSSRPLNYSYVSNGDKLPVCFQVNADALLVLSFLTDILIVWCGHGFESHSQPFLLVYPEADLSL